MAATIGKKECSLDDALDVTGFGKYSIVLLITCCAFILANGIDIIGFSMLLPPLACDLALTTAQMGLISAVPLIGVMISSYGWGLCADTLGRRRTLIVAMPIGMLLNFIAGLMPNFWSLAVVKFLSGAFTSSANAAAFVLLGESVPKRLQSRMMFIMAATTMSAQLVTGVFALPVFQLSFHIDIPWLGLAYRPWRLLIQILCLPGALGCMMCSLCIMESPKYLLCKHKTEETMKVLEAMYRLNTGKTKSSFSINVMYLNNISMNTQHTTNTDTSILRKMWNQTVPLFKRPLLKNSLILYYLLFCAFMVTTGFTMWVPTMTNAYFNRGDVSGKTLCEVASKSASTLNLTVTDCDKTIDTNAMYATMVYSSISGFLTISISFLVGSLGKKKTTQLVFITSLICGFAVLFVKIPILSIGLFFIFLYAAVIYGNINTYLVELNPTHLRGMATCLSVVVARGFGFMSVQLIAIAMSDYCVPMMTGYVILIGTGLGVSFFLPPDAKNTDVDVSKNTQMQDCIETTTEHNNV